MAEEQDPVLVGFSHLMNKYEPVFFGQWRDEENPPEEGDSSGLSDDEKHKTLQDLVDSMKHRLLPQLNHQLTTLSDLLFPSAFWKQPEMTRKLVLETQPELEKTIDQIQSTIATLCPLPTLSTSTRTDDQDLKGLKYYRLQRLKSKFNEELLFHLNQLFTRAYFVFQQIRWVPDQVRPEQFDGWPCREEFAKHVRLGSLTIASMVLMIDCSELDLVQQQWAPELQNIEETMKEMGGLIARSSSGRPSPLPVEFEKLGSFSTRLPANIPPKTMVIRLAQLTLPLVKISRLLFAKVSRPDEDTDPDGGGERLNRVGLPLYTSMDSAQIEALADAANLVHQDLADLLVILQKAANRATGLGTGETRREFSKLAVSLNSHLNSPLSLLRKYYLPLIAQIEGVDAHAYYTTWFKNWKSLFRTILFKYQRVASAPHPFL
ncbi:hypothetical protein PGT21_015877 [Puccinia graminis f. sp. tritici]|uniref:Uncharacterized protein n=1 Tax=Puccinia graminis f. sp. tritici TaxID=56615 RepID=A0A5B0RQA5_PUCGR|nr:hypothetical protein PGT21_015877 [Puccinia graminis f. sp. tritici]KAA1126844.1 hypothetical protein PGTUg99_027912 [Puccinia graminis f. sp. tritici]